MLLWKVPGVESLCPLSQREARISHRTSSSRPQEEWIATELSAQDGESGYPLACVSLKGQRALWSKGEKVYGAKRLAPK